MYVCMYVCMYHIIYDCISFIYNSMTQKLPYEKMSNYIALKVMHGQVTCTTHMVLLIIAL